MKHLAIIALFIAIATTGCKSMSHDTSRSRHLTEAQAIEIARPLIPLSAGESYKVKFDEQRGIWGVFIRNSPSDMLVGAPYYPSDNRSVVIRDADSKVLNVFGQTY